jgi:hypothetical protein
MNQVHKPIKGCVGYLRAVSMVSSRNSLIFGNLLKKDVINRFASSSSTSTDFASALAPTRNHGLKNIMIFNVSLPIP